MNKRMIMLARVEAIPASARRVSPMDAPRDNDSRTAGSLDTRERNAVGDICDALMPGGVEAKDAMCRRGHFFRFIFTGNKCES